MTLKEIFYNEVIYPVNTKYGAPMGRSNVGRRPLKVASGPNNRIFKKNQVKIYDKRVPMVDGAYDVGGAYWGLGRELRVEFTKDLSFINFYRR
jgi:hypothetical protein